MKFEITIISIVGFSIIDVLIWFILDFFNVELAKEIAIFIAIIFITLVIIYFIHGKGILEFDISLIKNNPRNAREGLKYSRINYRNNYYYKSTIRKSIYNREIISRNLIPNFKKYSRKKFR
ncbi:MAG: hypothetical protein ACFFDW_02955 [Candidatus Thorarchaeota archaeon]